MFKNALLIRIAPNVVFPSLNDLEAAMQGARFVPCGPTQPESSGWIAPRGNKSTTLVESVGGQILMKLCTERRQLPASAVSAAVEERIENYKKETGQERVGAKIKKAFKEEVVIDLLPRAFTKITSTLMWIDVVNRFVVVDSASFSAADQIATSLFDALGAAEEAGCAPANLHLRPVQTITSAPNAMAIWLSTREAPSCFTIDRDCELKTPDDMKAAVRYSRHTLEIDEVADHIRSGKVPTKLAMTWNDRASFVLSDTGQILKIKLLDAALDSYSAEHGKDDDGFDADVAIVTGELSQLIPDLLEALGGEVAQEGGAK